MPEIRRRTIRAIAPEDRDPIVVGAKYAIRHYTVRIPNRTALVGATILAKNDGHLISLPLLAIQEKAI